MNKIGLVLILSFVVNIFSFDLEKSEFEIKVNAPISAQFGLYQIFLPFISNEIQVYFVAPNGSDANPGTHLLPWKTIGKATRMVKPGDTVYIRDGIYNESVSFYISGTEANPIRIMAYPGETPIIDGGFSGYSGFLLNVRGDFIHLSGIEVRNSTDRGIEVYGDYDLIDNLYVHHSMAGGIFISQGQHSTVQNSRVWKNSLRNEYGQANGWASGLSVARYGVAFASIRHNRVWENWGEGISSFEADEITIEDNISHDNYSANIYISDSTNVLCQRNFVYMNPDSYIFGYGANSGIMMGDEKYTPPSAHITIINNIAFGNQGNFWWWPGVQGGGMDNVLIANNTFVNGIGDPGRGRGGVIISEGDHQNVRFENNLVQQDGDLPVIATVNQPGVTYSHNLWSKLPYSAASGPGDVIGDPKLSHAGEPYSPEWFRLTDLSPAIDKALLIPEVLDDYFNKPRGSFPDMGAIENFPD